MHVLRSPSYDLRTMSGNIEHVRTRSVLIVENVEHERAMLAGYVGFLDGYTVAESVGTLVEALAECAKQPIDIVVLDLQIPVSPSTAPAINDGVDCGRLIAAHYPDTKIAVVTNNFELNAVSSCAEFTQVVVDKRHLWDDTLDVLREALDAAAEGLRYIKSFDKELHRQAERDRYGFTNQEWKVIGLIHQGLSNEQIARELVISKRTVEDHKSAVGRKVSHVERFAVGTGEAFYDHGDVAEWYARTRYSLT